MKPISFINAAAAVIVIVLLRSPHAAAQQGKSFKVTFSKAPNTILGLKRLARCAFPCFLQRQNSVTFFCVFVWSGGSLNLSCCLLLGACESNPCHSNATCAIVGGSLSCSCRPGYAGNGFNCASEET